MAGQSNPFPPKKFLALSPLKVKICNALLVQIIINITALCGCCTFTLNWGCCIFTEIIFTVNMQHLKYSLSKTSKCVPFFAIQNAISSGTSINPQIYMTEAKPAQDYFPREHKNDVSIIMQHFSSKGVV